MFRSKDATQRKSIATEVIGGASREFYTGGYSGGGKRINGNVEVRNMIAENFLNPMPRQMNAHQGMAPNMMMPYYPMQPNSLGGAFNNCVADMGELVAAPQKKKNKKKKKVIIIVVPAATTVMTLHQMKSPKRRRREARRRIPN